MTSPSAKRADGSGKVAFRVRCIYDDLTFEESPMAQEFPEHVALISKMNV